MRDGEFVTAARPASADAVGDRRAHPSRDSDRRGEVPTDCRAILSDDVLAELGDTPLNDPAFGPSGVQADGSLICIWADPAADTTHLTTTITAMNRGPALDMLNKLADEEGFTCYTPDDGHPLREDLAERAVSRSPTGGRCTGATTS